jgi:hypothetical protein
MTTLLTDKDIAYMQDVIAVMLPDTCNILSEALASDGQGGQTSTWGTVSTGVACRLDESGQTGGNQLVPVAGALREAHRYMLSLPHDTTIGAHDRIEFAGNTYNVISVNDHISWQAVMRAVLELI